MKANLKVKGHALVPEHRYVIHQDFPCITHTSPPHLATSELLGAALAVRSGWMVTSALVVICLQQGWETDISYSCTAIKQPCGIPTATLCSYIIHRHYGEVRT